MLMTLLKHDIRRNAKYHALTAVVLGATLLLMLLGALTNIAFLLSLSSGISLLISMAALLTYFFTTFSGFYTQMCGNESYLTFTIPVGTAKTVLSKLLSAFFWGIMTVVMLIAFWLPATRILFPDIWTGGSSFREAVLPFLPLAGSAAVYLLIGLNLLIVLCCALVSTPFFTVRNAGVGMLAAVYIVLYELMGVLVLCIWACFVAGMGGGFSLAYLNDPANVQSLLDALNYAMLTGSALIAGVVTPVSIRIFDKRRSL